ncbi:uncharacterized protein LOC141643988 [Silene latifolia]|uniref:uncharacterized protein LOC141643988 n=1 Tax=Silene latifolia TaxID=37657 RepID=UPI003D779954
MDNIGCWSVRGINKPNKQADVKWFLHQNKVGLFVLVETKIKTQDFTSVLNNLGSSWSGMNNNLHHPKERVLIIWDPQVFNISFLVSSAQQITVKVTENSTDSYSYFMNEDLFDHSSMICYRRKAPQLRKTSFRYFNMWGKDSNFQNIIRSVWDKGVAGIPMFQNKYSDIEKSTEVARQQLDHIQTLMHNHAEDLSLLQPEKEAAKFYSELHTARFSFLQEKAKTDWLREGDANTAFYHRNIKARITQNKVLQIKDMNGITHFDPSSIEKAFLDYYISLLGTNKPVQKVHYPTVRTDSWDIIGVDVSTAVCNFFQNGKLLKQLNAINITLIPKTSNPTYVMEFRPIACCNTIYKCITKILYARLGDVLPDLICPNQRGFIKGRNIIENVLICQDLDMWLLRAFATFSKASGLTLNNDKSDIYFSGVPHNFIDEILLVSRFKRGPLPFKYLGIPISSKKMTKNDGMKLIDKITSKIRAWGARHLSYSGRLTLLVLEENCPYYEIFAPGDMAGKWLGDDKGYKVKDGYSWLRPSLATVPWRYVCWNDLNIPKTSFIYWATMHKRLLTKDRLIRMGIQVDPTCFLCGMVVESHDHLFFDCCYSKKCVLSLQQSLKISFPISDLAGWFKRGNGRSKLQRKITCALSVGLVYAIWNARNKARVDLFVLYPGVFVK